MSHDITHSWRTALITITSNSPLLAALRELSEEAGVGVGRCRQLGTLHFEFEGVKDPARAESLLEVHVYRGDDVTGTPIESEEMRPQCNIHATHMKCTAALTELSSTPISFSICTLLVASHSVEAGSIVRYTTRTHTHAHTRGWRVSREATLPLGVCVYVCMCACVRVCVCLMQQIDTRF